MNNFQWQFDPSFFERLVNSRGLGNALNISSTINSYAKDIVNYNEDLHKSGPRPLSALPAADIGFFPELLAFVVDKQQDFEGIDSKDRIEVRQKYVDFKPERDVIGWALRERYPGTFAQGKPGTKRVQEYTMHLRGVFKDPAQPGHAIAAFGKKMDNFIELCVMSGDSNSANRRALWLEDVLEESRWIFQFNGFERLLFHKREKDDFEDVNSNPCHKRPLIYYVRSEKIVLYRVALLRKLIFDLCVTPPGVASDTASKFNSVLQ